MSSASPVRPTGVDFHFDIMCPYAYQTSLWIRNVRDETGLDIRWKFFSLEEINRQEGKKHPWERDWSYGWSMMRIGALLRRQDMALLDRWYAEAGRALHEDGRKPHRPEVAEAILDEMGLDPGLVAEAIGRPHHRRRGEGRARRGGRPGADSGCRPWSSTTTRCCSDRSSSTHRRARPPSACGT